MKRKWRVDPAPLCVAATSSRWSLLTLIQGGARRTEQGTEDWGGINFLVDDSRLNYFLEWFDTPRVVHTERGLLGY